MRDYEGDNFLRRFRESTATPPSINNATPTPPLISRSAPVAANAVVTPLVEGMVDGVVVGVETGVVVGVTGIGVVKLCVNAS